MNLTFKGWERFRAWKQASVIKAWLGAVRKDAQQVFKAGMNGPHSGNVGYRKGGGRFIRSAKGEYPAVDSGALIASMKTNQQIDSATIGTGMYYAKWLRGGSRFMARRKMSDNAIREGAAIAEPKSRGWVAWQKR